ncbi:MAG: DASS family sodium-coupled anion symporter [Negativicutes bacterium]|nr:DASS family sodium-coupled anion symporter [Negativicutes bacterium]
MDTAVLPQKIDSQYKKQLHFVIGVAILVAAYLMPPFWGLKLAAVRTLGVMATTIFWWVTEALPIPVSGLLVLPLLHIVGAAPFNKVAAQSFGDPFVPFMVGCLALSVAFTQSGLGKRITYMMLSVAGTKVNRILNIFFWVSFCHFITDVAQVALMYPLGLSIARSAGAKPGKSNFGTCMMFAITFGAVIGGLCTPSGTPSNIITISFLEKNAGLTISFLQWLIIATPIAVVLGIIALWLIKRMYPPEMEYLPFGPEVIRKELADMGPWSKKEKITLVVFAIAVILWLTGDVTKMPIAVVSLLIVGLLTIPGISAFGSWKEVETNLAWGSLMLMIGGFAMGVAAFDSGLASWIAQYAVKPLAVLPLAMQPFAVTLLVAVDSLGFSSFTAAAAVNVPLVIAYSQQSGFPIQAMAMTAGLASSTHFILVTESLCFVLTYAAGYYTFKDLFKIGMILTIVGAIVISLGLLFAGMPMGTPLN